MNQPKVISHQDVFSAIQHIYKKKYKFGQDFIFVRGRGKGKLATEHGRLKTGVEEKLNALLGLGHLDADEVNLVEPCANEYGTIQESHHTYVALTIIHNLSWSKDGELNPVSTTCIMGLPPSVIDIIDGQLTYQVDVSSGDPQQFKLSAPIPTPAKYLM